MQLNKMVILFSLNIFLKLLWHIICYYFFCSVVVIFEKKHLEGVNIPPSSLLKKYTAGF